MSLSEISIEDRAIIKSLAATINRSAVAFRPAAVRPASGRTGALVFNCAAIELPAAKSRAQISRSQRFTQELIERLTKSPAAILIRRNKPTQSKNKSGESRDGRGIYRRCRAHRGRTQRRA